MSSSGQRLASLLGSVVLWAVPAGLLISSVSFVERFPRARLLNCDLLATCGSPGKGPAELAQSLSVAADANGTVYVADADNQRVQVFDGEGHWLRSWGRSGNGLGEFQSPVDVRLASDGTVWVLDRSGRLQSFNGTGQPKELIATSIPDPKAFAIAGSSVWLVLGAKGIYRLDSQRAAQLVSPLPSPPLDLNVQGGEVSEVLFSRELWRSRHGGALSAGWSVPSWLPVQATSRMAWESNHLYVGGADSRCVMVFSNELKLEGTITHASSSWFWTVSSIAGVGDGTLWIADSAAHELYRVRPRIEPTRQAS